MLPCPVLQIELNWLLDDAVAAQRISSDAWKPCSWRHLQSVHYISNGGAVTSNHDTKVALRLGLSALTGLWEQRTQERCGKPQSLTDELL